MSHRRTSGKARKPTPAMAMPTTDSTRTTTPSHPNHRGSTPVWSTTSAARPMKRPANALKSPKDADAVALGRDVQLQLEFELGARRSPTCSLAERLTDAAGRVRRSERPFVSNPETHVLARDRTRRCSVLRSP